MLQRQWVSALLAAAVFSAAPAFAQPSPSQPSPSKSSPAQPAAADAGEARREALVRRFLKASEFEKMMDTVIASMLPIMTEDAARRLPNITGEQRQAVTDAVREAMRETFTPRMLDRIVPVYAATFTEAELTSIVQFYESEAGQAIVAKMPSLAPKSAEITRELIPEVQVEVARRICEKLGCDAVSTPATSAS